MGNLNKEQLEAINNLAKTSKDYNNGEATLADLKTARDVVKRTLGVALTLSLMAGLSSCGPAPEVKSKEADTEKPKTEESSIGTNEEIQNHQEAFEDSVVIATEEILTKNVLSEDFFGEGFQKDPESYEENLSRIVEMTANYIIVNSIVEGKSVFTPKDLAVLDKDGTLPTLKRFVDDAHLGERNMEMLLTIAAYQNPAVDYSNFYVKKADYNYINNITNMINKLSRGMQANDEALVEEARQELLVEKNRLLTNDLSLGSISYVAIKEGFQKIEIANMAVEVLTDEEQEIINHIVEERCGKFKAGMTELDVKGSYIYQDVKDYLEKYSKIDASKLEGKTWDELIMSITNKVLEDILNKNISMSFYNEETNTFTIISNYLDAKINTAVYGGVTVTGGGCVTTKVSETKKTETRVVDKKDVPASQQVKDEEKYFDPKGNETSKEELERKAEEKQQVLVEIGENENPDIPVDYKDDAIVKEAEQAKQDAANYREEEIVPVNDAKEETVSVEYVTVNEAEPVAAISSIAIDENGNTYNESYREFYEEETTTEEVEYFGDDELIISISTEGGMSK